MQGKRLRALSAMLALALTGALAVVATAAARLDSQAAPTAAKASLAPSCQRQEIGLMAPITGPNATIGVEQRAWARYAVQGFNTEQKRLNRKVQVILRDGDTQLDPARASTVGQRFASNSNILGIVGPAGSQEVIAVDPIFTRTNLAMISGSATRTTLTNGSVPTFFRTVPNDSVQGPTIGRYLKQRLNAKRVVAIDDQTAYGQPLADGVAANLRAAGVNVSRESVNVETTTDFSSLATRVPNDADYVVLAWQTASKAQTFAQQLLQQGKRAVVFGTDGLFQPGQFRLDNSYISAFAPDIRNIPASRSFVTGFTKAFPGINFGTFGPPTFAATRAMINAIQNACRDGRVTRGEVIRQLKRTLIKGNILGGNLSFTPRGDVVGAKFYIFQIRDGKYVFVG